MTSSEQWQARAESAEKEIVRLKERVIASENARDLLNVVCQLKDARAESAENAYLQACRERETERVLKEQAVELLRIVEGNVPRWTNDQIVAFLALLKSKSSAGNGQAHDTNRVGTLVVAGDGTTTENESAPKAEDINSKRPSGHQVSYCGSNEVHEPHYGTFRGLPTNVWCPGRFTSRDVVRT